MSILDLLFGNKNKSSETKSTNEARASHMESTISTTSSRTSQKASPITFRSLDDIFKKEFRFVVDRYEEWENQRCTNSGDLNGEITARIRSNKIVFTLSGINNLNITNTISLDLSNPMTRILKSNGNPLIPSDRIQYYTSDIQGGNVPYICHLFCESGRISYIRFAFYNPNSSPLLPMAKRIYEFYGDMVELSGLTNKRTETNEFTPFVFRSTHHQRYENIIPVMGLQNCVRTVTVEKNTSGCSGYDIKPGDGYIVKIFNNDAGSPNMSDKPMRVKSISNNVVVLQGYPLKAMSPFGWMEVDYRDYGLEVHYNNGVVEKCILHMYERDTYIEYRK